MLRFWFLPFLFADNREKGGMLKGLMRLSRWTVILLGIATAVSWHYHDTTLADHNLGIIFTLASGVYFTVALGCAIAVHALYFFTSPVFRIPRIILFGGIVVMFVYYYKFGMFPFDFNGVLNYIIHFVKLIGEYL